ncbi:hypothetical protein GL218_01953 [Daldinia childiae]|uniref:uncharacterized protein n=1 Tax=Daldinia childiae TaxID=326645 RepID=UPI0014484E7A|nr:uncharacterized protein GL218_01953 [Daldinia childiae]KAF3064587.1 hypothetical protein GL218_01953 [Daldinia childiae]
MHPLRNVSQDDFAKLCEALWGWKPCADWIEKRKCQCLSQDPECHYQRAQRLKTFFDFYRETTTYYIPELTGSSPPAIETHDGLIRIIRYIKQHADKARLRLTIDYFGIREHPGLQIELSDDHNRAFTLAARVITMFECATKEQPNGQLEAGLQPTIWHSDKSFNQFVLSCIPRQGQHQLRPYNDTIPWPGVPSGSITMKRLKKIAKLTIIPTDDLGNHLLLDRKNGTIAVYHYTSVLKEHLLMTRESRDGTRSSTQQHRNLPKELALETLYTLKHVLFPIDPESRSLLQSLVVKDKFDPDICDDINTSWQQHEGPIAYEHWGLRLMDLYDELQNPTPRGPLEKWMERNSGSRYVMMATLAGVLIAVLLGILSLGVSIFQAWVGWQQWQHPVST